MPVGLLGKKIGMTAIYDYKGRRVPVTVIEAGPCVVTSVLTKEKNGYTAVQLGFGAIKEKAMSKPRLGLFKKAGIPLKRHLHEFRSEKVDGVKVGSELRVDNFKRGEMVDVLGTSVGRGFQGVVKRHHFKGGDAGHGSMFGRVPGSIGASAFPSRVMKGMRSTGHMGAQHATIQNLPVIKVDLENNLLVLKGSVPGSENEVLVIYDSLKKGAKNKDWRLFTETSIDTWKKEIEELRLAEEKKEADLEAKRKEMLAKAAKKAQTQAPGKKK